MKAKRTAAEIFAAVPAILEELAIAEFRDGMHGKMDSSPRARRARKTVGDAFAELYQLAEAKS